MRKSHEKCHIGIFLLSKEVKISLNEKDKAYTGSIPWHTQTEKENKNKNQQRNMLSINDNKSEPQLGKSEKA